MPTMLTKEELAEWLKASPTAINQLMREGMPYIKTGNVVRFERDAVKKWLDEQ